MSHEINLRRDRTASPGGLKEDDKPLQPIFFALSHSASPTLPSQVHLSLAIVALLPAINSIMALPLQVFFPLLLELHVWPEDAISYLRHHKTIYSIDVDINVTVDWELENHPSRSSSFPSRLVRTAVS
jgi:hypothetical protein